MNLMSNRILACWAACWVAFALLLVGCTPAPTTSQKPMVVTTTGFVGDMVHQLAGDACEVHVLIPPGVDPHLYKATPSDVAKLQKADVVVYSGLHLEGKMGDILERLSQRKPTVAVAESIPNPIQADGVPDPHVWMDPMRWREGIPTVAEALTKLQPEEAKNIQVRSEKLKQKFGEIDKELRDLFAEVPPKQRVLITAHDAFRYLGEAYGFEVLGVQGLSTETEAGLTDINRLVDRIVKDEIPSVFIETSLSPRSVEALIEGARARGATVRLGGTLYSDALGGPGSGAETTLDMLRTNAKTIVAGLK